MEVKSQTMNCASVSRVSLIAIALSILPAFATADLTFGSGRASGMGNAGLAVPYDWLYSGRLNPAIYGLAPESFRLQIPGLSYRLQGLNFDEFRDFAGSINDAGIDENKVSELARTIGDENSEFGAGVGLGIFTQGLMLDFGGEAVAMTRPNATLRNWVQTGSQGNVPANSRLDAYGVGGYEIGAGYGRRLNTPGNYDIAIGARAKFVKSYYTHRFVDSAAIQNNAGSALAPEMNGKDSLDENGFGLDVGVVASTSKTEGLFFGATVENLIEPKVTFDGTLPGGSPGTSTVRPYRRSFNVGTGYLTPNKFLLAADFYDVFNGAGTQEFRAGAEFKSTSWFAVRGGYASRSGFTVGLGLGSINLAYSSDLPSQLSYSFRF